jgi:hypothetical protein
MCFLKRRADALEGGRFGFMCGAVLAGIAIASDSYGQNLGKSRSSRCAFDPLAHLILAAILIYLNIVRQVHVFEEGLETERILDPFAQ